MTLIRWKFRLALVHHTKAIVTIFIISRDNKIVVISWSWIIQNITYRGADLRKYIKAEWRTFASLNWATTPLFGTKPSLPWCHNMRGDVLNHHILVSIVYSNVCSGADQRKHQRSASLAFVRGIHRWPVNFPRKGPVTRKMFPFNGVSMIILTNTIVYLMGLMETNFSDI